MTPGNVRKDRLTPNELALLRALGSYQPAHKAAWLNGGQLVELLPNRSYQGIHVTGASLVRKGLALRGTPGGRIAYRLTQTGEAKLDE